MIPLILLATAHLLSPDPLALDHASVSVYAVHTDTGEVIVDHNSDLSMMPASCIKIVTTAAALEVLGGDSRFETHLEHDGWIDESRTLHGNLYIRGGGDPCLGSDRIAGNLSWQKQLEAWAVAVQNLGIKNIEGKVIPDASRWEKALAVHSWNWGDLGNYYGAGACALTFHENSYTLTFKPGNDVGDCTTILRTDPPIPSLTLYNEVKTGPEGSGDQAYIFGSEYSLFQFVRGTIPAAVSEFSIRGAIPDPAATVSDLFTRELQKQGITIQQKELAAQNPKIAFHTTYSPPLKEIAHWTNQKSINLYAEHLCKKMGEVACNDGSTDAGVKAITDFWQSKGIDLGGFEMADGSGLSRKNLVTTKQLVAMLLKIKSMDFFPDFFASLPEIAPSIRAKDGFFSLVRGYAGYKGPIAFAILVNQCPDRKLMDTKIRNFLSTMIGETMGSTASSNPINVDVKNGICRIEGKDFPIVGFGTYPLTGKKCTDAVKNAIHSGYRIIDTATYYKNFSSIAKALKGKDRSDYYITSKVWHNMQSPKDVHKDIESTLKQLQTDYIDAYLVHWPNSKISIEKTLLAMEELRKTKKVRHIGLSNVTINHLKRALEVGVPITWVQIEMHPNFYDKDLLDFCQKQGITVEAWRPLNLGLIKEDKMLAEIGKTHRKTPCQIALRWIVQHGCIPIPGSSNENHIQENLDITDFTLSKEEMDRIDKQAASGARFRLVKERGLGFSDEFDFAYEQCWPKNEMK